MDDFFDKYNFTAIYKIKSGQIVGLYVKLNNKALEGKKGTQLHGHGYREV